MQTGCYTALVTPFTGNGEAVDYEGLRQLTEFQIQNGITGILAVGTTGESPTLTWDEHNKVVEIVAEKCKDKCVCIAGAGSNNTKEALEASMHAAKAGANAVLLVDPYYNGPSSQEIRKEYIAPVAKAFPKLSVIPYIIPGRTGAQMFPEDLAIAASQFSNVNTVKEATGDLENMRRTRACCGPDFVILSGDDALTFDMMTDPGIRAAGVISVASNVAPKFVTEMVRYLDDNDLDGARKILEAISPLFDLVSVITAEQTPYGDVTCRARNPLGLKTLMCILGMPSGPCRPPMGKMSPQGLEKVLNVARDVQARNPEVFAPIADFFNIDIAARLNDPSVLGGLAYETY